MTETKKNKPYKITKMDAIEYLKTLPDCSVDLVVMDPPYESLEKWRNIGTTTRLKNSKGSSNEWFHVMPNSRLPELIAECKRVMKKGSHIYIHCDETTADVLKPIIRAAGLKFWKSLVWHKMAIGMGYHWRATYEFILFAEKGKRKLNMLGLADIFRIKRLKGPQYYPTQKPEKLARMLVENSSNPGDVVLDPFMGAGTTGAAAVRTGRIFWGCDIDDKAYAWTKDRLDKIVQKLEDKAAKRAIKEAAEKAQAEYHADEQQEVASA